MRPEKVNDRLRQVIDGLAALLEKGAIISVTEQQARVRILPLEAGEAD